MERGFETPEYMYGTTDGLGKEITKQTKQTKNSSLPTDPKLRKQYPVGTGVIDYFADALAEVAYVSYIGNEQHNPGQKLHWDRSKSSDEADALIRHFMHRGTLDTDGTRHTAKMVWRALALFQKELEEERKKQGNE